MSAQVFNWREWTFATVEDMAEWFAVNRDEIARHGYEPVLRVRITSAGPIDLMSSRRLTEQQPERTTDG